MPTPVDTSLLRAQAAGFCRAGRWAEALACFQSMLRANPLDPQTLCDAGLAHSLMGQGAEALEAYGKAVNLAPDWADPYKRMGEIWMTADRAEDAAKAFSKAAHLGPKDPDAWIKWGIALSALGNKAQAVNALRYALDLDPKSAPAYYNLSGLKTFAADDPEIATLEALAAEPGLSPYDQTLVHFTLGKAWLDAGVSARAFGHFHQGNRLKRESAPYDVDADIARMDLTRAVVTPAVLDALMGGGNPSSMPIFVVGMPRSGSTLVEQILASHSQVAGAGEISTFRDIVRRLNGTEGNPALYPDVMALLSPETTAQIGALYLSVVSARAEGRPWLVDKFLENFLYAGLILACLPNARIIHCRRDPVDTCLSCYTLLFGAEQNFTYDMTDLGRYWRAYDRLMDHWRQILPPERFIEVRYEDLVADLEGQVRSLLERLGLPFEAACLEFHQTQRVVNTASAQQVRQPIYKGSVGRWKAHAEQIAPLLDALNPQTI